MRLVTSEITSAIVIAAAAGAVLLAFYWQDRDMCVRRHYLRNNPTLYAMMQACIFVLSVAIAYNARFLVSHVAKRAYTHVVARLR
jgi:uncharacterized membrane-anchored protein